MKLCFALLWACSCGGLSSRSPGSPRWSEAQASQWQTTHGWILGANFIPSNAVNQLEMWQADTFDPATIDRELALAAGVGINSTRVFLHDLAWRQDPSGFLERMDHYLTIAHRHGISTMFVLFDDCWNGEGTTGPQPPPVTGVHNSRWLQSPLRAQRDAPHLEAYVTAVLRRFANDPRVLMWDLYNEVGNSGYHDASLPLLKRVFAWAWRVRPSQPLTSGTWYANAEINAFVLAVSDVITFHNYDDARALEGELQDKAVFGRPVVCTEYMARPRGSLFATHLPLLRRQAAGAMHWGLVQGKTNTTFAWDAPGHDSPWFHDVFHPNGEPYDADEVAVLRASRQHGLALDQARVGAAAGQQLVMRTALHDAPAF